MASFEASAAINGRFASNTQHVYFLLLLTLIQEIGILFFTSVELAPESTPSHISQRKAVDRMARGRRRKLRTRIYYEEFVAGKGFCNSAKKNKIRFLSKGAAYGAIPFIHYLHPDVKPFYAYFCLDCRIWHLATDKDKLPLQEDIPIAA